jgi:hypothetical protein
LANPGLDLVRQTDKLKAEERQIFLDLKSWRSFRTTHALKWQKTRFKKPNPAIPKVRGLYAFTLELFPTILPPHGYILYVGITGDKAARTLRERYNEYFVEARSANARPKVQYMLVKWQRDLFFNYVELPDPSIDLKELESAFINAVRPPVNERDFRAKVSRPRRAKF